MLCSVKRSHPNTADKAVELTGAAKTKAKAGEEVEMRMDGGLTLAQYVDIRRSGSE